MEISSSDIEYLADVVAVTGLVICFCLGWIAGAFR